VPELPVARTLADDQKGTSSPVYRKLWPSEFHLLQDHLLRLSPESRQMRFGNLVNDPFIDSYCQSLNGSNNIVYGCLIAGRLRASAELHLLSYNWPLTAELAFSVEDEWQGKGHGSQLMESVLLAARNRNISRLYMLCMSENSRMRHIAEKYHGALTICSNQIECRLDSSSPDLMSLFSEWFNDTADFITYTPAV